MTDLAFLAHVAELLVARASAADAPDPGEDGRRVLDAVRAAVSAGKRLTDDPGYAETVRELVVRAYAIPALARDLPDPGPAARPRRAP